MKAEIVHGLSVQVCQLAGFSVDVYCGGCRRSSDLGSNFRGPHEAAIMDFWDRLRCSDCGAPISSLQVSFQPGTWGRALDVLKITRQDVHAVAQGEYEAVCNAYKLQTSVDEIASVFSEIKLPLRFKEGIPNLEPRLDIRITDGAPVIRSALDGELEMVERRWSWPGVNGKPVYNFRSEGRRFNSGRCLIPADAFYEYTDPPAGSPKAARKTKWVFSAVGEPWLGIAGVLRRGSGGEAFSMLTTEPGPDVAPYHKRQVVVLAREDWAAWLLGGENERRLLRPSATGTLTAQRAP